MLKRYSVKGGRLPNLGTVIMVEEFLKKQKNDIEIPRLKEELPKKVMHQTLKIILMYLWDSNKIEYTPEGVRWVFKR